MWTRISGRVWMDGWIFLNRKSYFLNVYFTEDAGQSAAHTPFPPISLCSSCSAALAAKLVQVICQPAAKSTYTVGLYTLPEYSPFMGNVRFYHYETRCQGRTQTVVEV